MTATRIWQNGGSRSPKSEIGFNSTTTALSGGATFTGAWETNDYPEVGTSTKSDVAGTLYYDFSNDGGSNYDTFPASGFALSAGVHEFHTAVKLGRTFRTRIVNGSAAQSYLRHYTYFGENFRLPSSPNNQALGRDQDAIAVRPTLVQDEISIGLRSGISQFNKFGYKSNSTAAGGEEVIWPLSTAAFTILTSASTFTVTYDGTGGGSTDGASTTGARALTFYYIDSNGEAATATHTLGTDGSDETSFSGLGINRIAVSSTGSNRANASAITITATTGGSNQAYIPAGEGVTQQMIYHTPTNARALAKWLYIRCNKLAGANPVVTFYGWVYNRAVASKFLVYRETLRTADSNLIDIIDPCNFPLTAGDVLYFTMDTDTNNTIVESRVSINVYNNA